MMPILCFSEPKEPYIRPFARILAIVGFAGIYCYAAIFAKIALLFALGTLNRVAAISSRASTFFVVVPPSQMALQ
jgi:hypothetical protein